MQLRLLERGLTLCAKKAVAIFPVDGQRLRGIHVRKADTLSTFALSSLMIDMQKMSQRLSRLKRIFPARMVRLEPEDTPDDPAASKVHARY